MQRKDEIQTGLASELKIVPSWAWAVAGIVFVAAQWFFNLALASHVDAPPAWCRPILGLLAGIGGGCYLLFIGYINRDAKRRGMSPVLWTIVAVIIPNALGTVLYFVLRQPRQSTCPQCASPLQPGFNFCPRCNHKLNPSCPQCQRVVGEDSVYCPYCGTSMRNSTPSTSDPTGLPG